MLRFYADKFVDALNVISKLEALLRGPPDWLDKPEARQFYVIYVENLIVQLRDLNLNVSCKKAKQLITILKMPGSVKDPGAVQTWAQYCASLREIIEFELEGCAIYYLSSRVELLEPGEPLFGAAVEKAFPSARYDIAEAGKCLALRRSTACVLHLMRALQSGLICMAQALDKPALADNWNTILNEIETEIRSRNKGTHGEKWKNEDEPYFAAAATHFRFLKNAWRNHASHAKARYNEEEAEEIYASVRAFMRHLSQRLSEPGDSSETQPS